MSRRQARSLALQALYEADTVGHEPLSSLEQLLKEKGLPQASASFAKELLAGVVGNRASLDATISQHAPAFPPEELSPVDRNILRLALWEILFDNRVPMKVAIDEAVELAKTFGSNSSSRFINGVLGSVVRQRR